MKKRNTTGSAPVTSDWSRRRGLVLCLFAGMGLALVARAVHVQLINDEFYRSEGQQRQIRTVSIAAHRGDLLDRHGEPLSISAPIPSLYGHPARLIEQPDKLVAAARLVGRDPKATLAKMARAAEQGKVFAWLERQVEPAVVKQVMALDIDSLSVKPEYRRYYPSGGAAAHLVGFTGIDDTGREGLELSYDDWLSGKPGLRRIRKDREGREIAGMDVIEPAVAGKDLTLSIDRQLQYFASRALQEAVTTNEAASGTMVMLDVKTGEVMAMANYPTFNPNDRDDRGGRHQRNRAVTDVFEPGSTVKPITVAAALESGRFKPESIVHTSPGYYSIGKYVISDDGKDHGWLDLTRIVTRSSNVGISKVARDLEPEQMWSVFDAFGFGRPPGSEFPGEVAGYFNPPAVWHHIEQASVSYGYGLSVSALQLARAYAALANDGVMMPVSFLKQQAQPLPDGERVIDEHTAAKVQRMLEAVVVEGSGKRAAIPGYRVAGKTGTSHKSQSGGYAEDSYVSLFAGYAPASDPQLAAVVVIHDPKAGQHFGGAVAAPVFAEIMSHGLRLEGIEPDDIDSARDQITGQVIRLSATAGERS